LCSNEFGDFPMMRKMLLMLEEAGHNLDRLLAP
jgi:hypothetical protein